MTAAATDFAALKRELIAEGRALGFGALGVAGINIPEDERHLVRWLDEGWHGEMHYMQAHGLMRSRPAELSPGTVRVVSARMDYWPEDARAAEAVLADGTLGYVSRYALGRDYHKILRQALQRLAEALQRRGAGRRPPPRPAPARSATASAWTVHRCWRKRTPAMPA
jgi:epoxyqueuosine reductase